MKKYFYPVIVIACLFLSVSCNQHKTEWKGTIEEKDGVVTVKNPIEPIYGEEAFVYEEELTIGEVEGREEYMFQRLRSVAVSDRGDIFVLDYGAQHVKVFDKDGQYLRTISRAGQGPGELQLPLSLDYTSRDEIVVGDMNRVSFFSTEGEYLKGIPLTTGSLLSVEVDAAGHIFGVSINRDKMVYELKSYDQELKDLISFGSSPLPTEEYRRTGKRNAFFSLLRWDIINGDQVVTGYAEEGYIIKILDASGSLVRKIEKDYVPVEISQKDFEEEIADLPPELKKDYYAPKHFPPFLTLIADDAGRIWVITSEMTPDKEKRIYDVFDAEGKYILKVALRASPRFFNNKMYTIEENDDGYQSVKRFKVTWNY